MFGIDLAFAFLAGLIWWELLLIVVVIIGGGIALKNESSLGFFIGFAILLFVPWTGAGSLWAGIDLISFIWYGVLFIIAGIGWSFFKWKLFVQNIIDRFESNAKNYSHQHHTQYTKQNIKEEINNSKDYDIIIYWIMLWPFSMIGYFINDFVYNLIKGIIDRIYTVYDRITDKLISKSSFDDEIKEDE